MLFSKRDVLKILLPLIAQCVLSVTIGLADSMMVSTEGGDAISGVSLVNTLDTLLVITFNALVNGGAVVVAQYLGKRDMPLVRSAAKQLLYVPFFVSLFITVFVLIFRHPILNLLFGSVTKGVMTQAMHYFVILALSFPFLSVFSSCSAVFRSAGNSTLCLIVSVIMNVINVLGNAILIYVFHMAAAGAAIASLFCRVVGALIMLVCLQRKNNPVRIDRLFVYKPDFKIIRSILAIGVPNGIESSMFQFGKLLTQALISTFGTISISANAVANTLALFQYMTGDAFAGTMITVVGRCVGAREKEQAKYYGKKLLFASYIFLWIMILLTCIFAKPIIGAYDIEPEAKTLARTLILYHSACALILWPISFVLPGAFRAANDIKFPLYVSSACMWICRVAFAYVFALDSVNIFGLSLPGLGLGVFGVWMAMTFDWVFRTALYAFRFFTGKWLTKYNFNAPVFKAN